MTRKRQNARAKKPPVSERMRPGVEHKPTDRSRSSVQHAIAAGLDPEVIASMMDISLITLKKHYAMELKAGHAKVLMMVNGALMQKIARGSEKSIHFWMGRRGGPGWKQGAPITPHGQPDQRNERSLLVIEKSDDDVDDDEEADEDGPAPIDSMDPDELEALKTRVRAITQPKPKGGKKG